MRLTPFNGLIIGLFLAVSMGVGPWVQAQEVSAEAREKIQMGLFREELGIACQAQGQNLIRAEISQGLISRIDARLSVLSQKVGALQEFLKDPAAGLGAQTLPVRQQVQVTLKRELSLPALAELSRLAGWGDRYQALRERASECLQRSGGREKPAPHRLPAPDGNLRDGVRLLAATPSAPPEPEVSEEPARGL
jgi:hypothetical protein